MQNYDSQLADLSIIAGRPRLVVSLLPNKRSSLKSRKIKYNWAIDLCLV